jgi:myo-inositol-1(or 4)-monophosphatase
MKITNKLKKELLDFALDLSYEAGEILLKYQKKRQELIIKNKGSEEGIASEADEKSEALIIQEIKNKYPNHYILSEEDYANSKDKCFKAASKADIAWLIDPLAGTNNFVNGIPIYAVSIGIIHHGMPIVGVVYNPTSGECFFASEGEGAFLIDFRINPFKKYTLLNEANNKEMNECIFSPAPVYETSKNFEQQLTAFRKNIIGARAVRRLGSAALELCYVANGNFDG